MSRMGTTPTVTVRRKPRRPLRPGDKLPTESAIMREHGVSRTVVREAISGLQAAGFVEIGRGIGAFVLDSPASPRVLEAYQSNSDPDGAARFMRTHLANRRDRFQRAQDVSK